MEIKRKKVDESWKAQIENEKEQQEQETQSLDNLQPNFQHIISIFATQALLAMGDIPNPLTGEHMIDLQNAKFNIDTLQLLQQKTQGNLEPEESQYLSSVLYDLRMRYVQKAGV